MEPKHEPFINISVIKLIYDMKKNLNWICIPKITTSDMSAWSYDFL